MDHMVLEGYQPKNKVSGNIKLPKGGFGLEKSNKRKDLIDKPIQCHSCNNKDICKYQGDYLEQVVHIIDVYDGTFELNCNYYESEIKYFDTKTTIRVFKFYNSHRCDNMATLMVLANSKDEAIKIAKERKFKHTDIIEL